MSLIWFIISEFLAIPFIAAIFSLFISIIIVSVVVWGFKKIIDMFV